MFYYIDLYEVCSKDIETEAESTKTERNNE